MDPNHRDQIAFLRVCSGKFTRDMKAFHSRTGKTIRLASSHRVFGRERETVDEAFPGDVIGLVGHSGFGIGDTHQFPPAGRRPAGLSVLPCTPAKQSVIALNGSLETSL